MKDSTQTSGSTQAKKYSQNKTFYIGDQLLHPKHGLGTVKDSFANKIEVLFSIGPVVLTHMVMF